MQITLSPIRSDAALALHRAGDVLSLDGVAFDFGPLPEAAVLPQAAVGCRWLAGDVTRLGGRLRLQIYLPHGAGADAAILFPAPLQAPEGPVDLPGQPGAARRSKKAGAIDWACLHQPDPKADLAQACHLAELRLAEAIEATSLGLTGTVPLTEKLSWTAKEEAARAVLAGRADPAHHALLAGEAAITGEALADLATRILRKADAWRQAIARLSGVRRQTVAAMATAPDTETVEAILAKALAMLEAG